MREIVRAGIDAVDRGQMEAAKSLGMTYGLAMRRIVLPQAARVIVPPLGNEFNNMLKTTSLLAFIGVDRAVPGRRDPLLADVQAGRVLRRGRVLVPRADERSGASSRHGSSGSLAASERGEELSLRERMARRVVARGRVGASMSADDVVDARGGRAQALRPPRGAQGRRHGGAARRDHLRHRPVGLGQDDVHPLHQPPREDRQRPDRGERAADRLPRAQRKARRGLGAVDREAARAGRDGLPALQPLPAQDRARERHRGAGARPRLLAGAQRSRRRRSCSRGSASRTSATPIRASSRAASSSASRSPARWR